MKEKIFFKTSKGNRLCGILSTPTSERTKPIIILCHGFTTSKEGTTHQRLEEMLNENEISTLRFDFFGHGESEGKFEDITTSEAVDDILSALELLKDLGYKRIGLVGSSFGGLASLIAASKTDDLQLLALKSPVSDYSDLIISRLSKKDIEKWKKKGFTDFTGAGGKKLKLKYSFYADAKRIKGYQAARKIKIPVLIVHGHLDETVPADQSRRTAHLIANCRLEIIEGADHRYTKSQDFERMLELISDFVLQNI